MASKPLTTAAAIAASARAAAASSTQSPSVATKKPLPSMGTIELEPEMAIESVRIDGLAVMKIIKHAREASSQSNPVASGQLLGLDSKGLLTVSDAIPLPYGSLGSSSSSTTTTNTTGEKDEFKGSRTASKYTNAVLPRLSALGSDANIVGFYTSTSHGQHLATPGFLENLSVGQLGPSLKGSSKSTLSKGKSSGATKSGNARRGVALVYDIAASTQGTVNLKAYRLSQAYIDAHRVGRFDSQSLIDHKLTHGNILEELPLSVQSSALLNAFLATLVAPNTLSNSHNSLARSTSTPFSIPQSRSTLLSPAIQSFAPLALASASDSDSPAPLSDSISALLASLEVHNAALSTLNFQSRQLARDRTRLEGLISKRKADNESRASQGLPPLPPSAEEAALQEPSRLDTMGALAGVEAAAQQLSESSGTDLVRAYGAQAAVSAV